MGRDRSAVLHFNTCTRFTSILVRSAVKSLLVAIELESVYDKLRIVPVIQHTLDPQKEFVKYSL